MKRLCLGAVKQAFAILIFITVGVLPIYGQSIEGFIQENAQSSETTAQSRSVQISGRSEADRITASRFTLIAGETPAFSVNESRFAFSADETPALPQKQNTTPPFVFPTRRERFNRYVKSTVGPVALLRVGVGAGINQWRDHPEEWEQGASGYGKRFASGFGRNVIQQTVIYGLDSALGLDTGFRRSGLKGFFPRMKHALAENITSRTKTGKRVVSVPRITGVYASKIISDETWYPPRYSYKDGLRSGTKSLLTDFGINLIREFVVNW